MNRYQPVSKKPLQPAHGVLRDGSIRANGIIRRQHEPPASFCSLSFHVRRPGWLQLSLCASNGLLYPGTFHVRVRYGFVQTKCEAGAGVTLGMTNVQ